MSSRRAACPPWCIADHAAHPGVDHASVGASLDAGLDAVTASVAVLAFEDAGGGELRSPTLVTLRLSQHDLADKDSVELSPAETRQLASMLLDAARVAERDEAGDTVTLSSLDWDLVAAGTPRRLP